MKSICFLFTVLSWFGLTSVWADEPTSNNVLDKRFRIYGGIQYYQADGDFRSTRRTLPEIEISMDDLGLDKSSIYPAVGAVVNFGKRWTLHLDYFGYHDDATATSDSNFNFDDLIVPVGARVDSSLDLDVYAANLAYNLIHSKRARFGVGAGLHAVNIDLELSAKITVDGKQVSLGSGDEDFLAPVPNLHVYGVYAITNRFLLRYGGGWLSLKYGDYDGSLLVAQAFLEYWPFQYAGFGAGYRYVNTHIEYDDGTEEMELTGKLPGPVLYVTFGF